MFPVTDKDGQVVGWSHGASAMLCHHANEYPTHGCTCPSNCPCHQSSMIPCQEGDKLLTPSCMPYAKDFHTPAPFRYPSTTDELLKFGGEYFKGCLDLIKAKNARYAGSNDPFRNLKIAGDYGIAVRMSDKVTRLLTLLHPGNTIDGADESIEDTCNDLANYAMLMCALRRNERGETK